MKIRPLRDSVLVEILETKTKKETQDVSCLDPKKGQKEVEVVTSCVARVLAVGPGEFQDGQVVPVPLFVNDVVLLDPHRYDNKSVEHDGKQCVLVDAYEVLAVVEAEYVRGGRDVA